MRIALAIAVVVLGIVVAALGWAAWQVPRPVELAALPGGAELDLGPALEHGHAAARRADREAVAGPPPELLAAFHVGDAPADVACVCGPARRWNGWCHACRRGWVAGAEFASPALFEMLDAHGHEIDLDAIACDGCRQAHAADGFCPRCRWGFVGGKLYYSPLTWSLARAENVAPAALDCDVCRVHAGRHGWCGTCGAGMIGAFRFDDRALFDQAVAGYEHARRCAEESRRCEVCATAMLEGTMCPRCDRWFEPPPSSVSSSVSSSGGPAADATRLGHDIFHPSGMPPQATCVCDLARSVNAWCHQCGVGYLAGRPVRSALVFEALDAHGHEFDPRSIECATCRAAMRGDGFCVSCRCGYREQRLYFSRLTHALAFGHFEPASGASCAVCRAAAAESSPRWCDLCRAGRIDGFVFRDPARFATVSEELERLERSMEHAVRCEVCAVASYQKTRCPLCDRSFADGRE